MAISAKEVFQLLKKSGKDFGEDECPRMAAALAYYIVFAMPAMLILLLMIVSAFVSRDTVQEALSGQFGSMIGPDGAKLVTTMITQAKQPGGGVIATILGIGAVVLGATGAFLQLQAALNRAWEVKPDPNAGGIKNFIFKRVLSLGMVLGIAFMLLVSLALSAALTAIGGMIGQLIPGGSAIVAGILQTVISLGVVFLLFAAIFKVLPDAEIRWKDVWVGALVTAVLFEVGKWGLGLYLGNSNPGKAYGAAGSMAVMLVWIYYTSMIVLFGAEFTQTWANERGQGILPDEGAVKVVEETREISREEVKQERAPGGTASGGSASGDARQGKGRAPSAGEKGGRDDGGRDSRPRERTPQEIAERAVAATGRDRAPDPTPTNQSGLPGGGVGRVEDVGLTGVHPIGSGTAPKNAEPRAPGEWAGGDARNADDDERR
ncbi:MAG TPA: YihY/virulence factor BrkB family protein [Longimicrobium sp.]|nr:YihY/virulence factor BrkB family protein [Longimicrobium sp.]